MTEKRIFRHPILKELMEVKPKFILGEEREPAQPIIDGNNLGLSDYSSEIQARKAKIDELINKWNEVIKVHTSLEGTTCKAVQGMEKSPDKDKLIHIQGLGWFLSDKIGNLDQFLKESDFIKEEFDKVIDPLLSCMRTTIDVVLDQNSDEIVEMMVLYFNFLLEFHNLLLKNYCLNSKMIPKSPRAPNFRNDKQILFSKIVHAREMIMPGDVGTVCRNILLGTKKRLKSDKSSIDNGKRYKPNATIVDALIQKYKKRNVRYEYKNNMYDCVFTYIVFKARKAFVLLDSVEDFDVNNYRKYQACINSYDTPYDLIYVIGKMILIDTTNQTAYCKEVVSDTTLASLIKHFGIYCENYQAINDLSEALA